MLQLTNMSFYLIESDCIVAWVGLFERIDSRRIAR